MAQPRVLGIFSQIRKTDLGVGGTAHGYVQTTYWFVRRLADDSYEVQPLNANNVPSGPTTVLSKRDFLQNYTPEPGYYEKKALPFIESLRKKIAKGEAAMEGGNLDAAEKEFVKALLLDDNNARASLDLASVYQAKRDFRKLKDVFERLLNLDGVFREENRHLFNSFGINLRKDRLFEEAVRYYQKALEASPQDEHLHFNMARAYHGQDDLPACRRHLSESLRLNPELTEAARFLAFLDKGDDGADAPDLGAEA